ncbi:MAG: hypothetical protein ACI828_000523 [Flavobacteriales bacterium]
MRNQGVFFVTSIQGCFPIFVFMKQFFRLCLGVLAFLLSGAFSLFAQSETEEIQTTVDTLYREDQLYIGLSLDLLMDTPQEFSQNGFSGGFQVGFIRDMPLNKRRNKSIGVGLGVAVDVFNQNLFIGEEPTGNTTIYIILDSDIERDKNRFSYYTLEMPIEYRWRTSTAKDYSFWRIYGGVQLGYIYHFKADFQQTSNSVAQTDIRELNRLQYGVSVAFGYSAFNLKVYYGLNTLFNNEAVLENGENMNLRALRLGIQFYFL